MQMAIIENTGELEARLASAASVQAVEDLCESALTRLDAAEAKLGKLESKLKSAVGKSRDDYNDVVAAAAAAAAISKEVPEASTGAASGEANAGLVEDLRVREDLKLLEKRVDELQRDVMYARQDQETLSDRISHVDEKLTKKLRSQYEVIDDGLERQTGICDALRSELRGLVVRVEPLEEGPERLIELRDQTKQLMENVKSLESNKASVTALEAVATSLEELEQLVAENQQGTDGQLSSLVEHCERLDSRVAPLEDWREQAKSELRELLDIEPKVSAELESLTNKAQGLAAAQEAQAKAQEEALDHRCSMLDEQIREEAGRLTTLEDRHESLSFQHLEGNMRSADDVAVITDKLSLIEEGIKDKEQNVLFSAKCLSCNRSYEDVAKMPGGVDLHCEKQKAQVWAEIQRALHTPRTSKTEELRVIAVKVGRPTGTKAKVASKGGGAFASRDQSTWSYGLEDVQLLRSPSPRVAGRRFLSPMMESLPLSSRAQTSLGMRGSPDIICGGLRPGTSIGLTRSGNYSKSSVGDEVGPPPISPRASGTPGMRPPSSSFFQSQEHGPLDFQQRLSELVKS
eukprot:TRINITY_DN23746_c0_g1_i1.p1 TRINITY_DN23746_c0_g1~~TRINITY_DN23746_c0_g1_i1.p1  ORF type:complete len:641 (-),score=141.98 TRINITY_DN23746_c0_g1_i1:342-2063(-)